MIDPLPYIPNTEIRPARYQGDLGEYLTEYYLRRIGFDVGRIGSKSDLLCQGPHSLFSVEVKSCKRPRTREQGPDYYKFDLAEPGHHPDYYAFAALDKQLVIVEDIRDVTTDDAVTRYFREENFTVDRMRASFSWLAQEHAIVGDE